MMGGLPDPPDQCGQGMEMTENPLAVFVNYQSAVEMR
jgi:hypothetical protein